MPIRTLIVDDEEPARERLRQLLAAHGDVEVVGEAGDGEEALERIEQVGPALVFLDIQMPGCSGTEVVASLPSPRPHVIFCTAYDQYAVDAFELHAVDYLLKPINRARLAQALDRVRARGTDDAGAETALDRAGAASGEFPTRFLARRSRKYCVVPREAVVAFVSEGGLTKLLSGDRHYWMQPTLTELEARLDPDRFFRVSRAAIVNLDGVREVRPVSGGYGEVALANGLSLEVSRRRFKDLLARLGGC